MQLQSNLRSDIPAQRRADHARAEVIVPCLRVPEHDSKVLRDVVKHDEQGVLGGDVLLGAEKLVLERLLVGVKVEILRVSGA